MIVPTGEETDFGYDPHDNLTSISHKDANGIVQATETFTVNGYGERTDYFDANNHQYQYGYDGNGCLSSVTTPLGHMTHFTSDGFGFRTSRTDAQNRQTTYTPDALERLWTITYPDQSTKTFSYDCDNDLTSFTDVTGTTNRTYDVDDRLVKETHGLGGGNTIVQHSYDAAGKLGLLSTTTDSNGRVMTYSWDAGNRLSKVAESAGTTIYGYDGNDDETSIVNENGTKEIEGYDTASQLTSVTHKTSGGTVLSSFSYVLDGDGRRKNCTEADGSVVSYGYD